MFISCTRYFHSSFSHSNTQHFLSHCKDSKPFYIGLRPQKNNMIWNEICMSGSTKQSIKHYPRKGYTLSRPTAPYFTQMLKTYVHWYTQRALTALKAGRTYHVVLKTLIDYKYCISICTNNFRISCLYASNEKRKD
jgi:hypothetical protein